MIVSWDNLDSVIKELSRTGIYGLDTETYGLDFDDILFSIIIANDEDAYYFNFNPDTGCEDQYKLDGYALQSLQPIFSNPESVWYIHNAKFDMQKLALDNLYIDGEVKDTVTMARLEYNYHMSYKLKDCLKRANIGHYKDDRVEEYIAHNKLFDMVDVPGRKTKKKIKYYDRVPFHLITEYGMKDAVGVRELGMYLHEKLI